VALAGLVADLLRGDHHRKDGTGSAVVQCKKAFTTALFVRLPDDAITASKARRRQLSRDAVQRQSRPHDHRAL
jgi:hypothetical protein